MFKNLPVLVLTLALSLGSPLAYAKNNKSKGNGKNKGHQQSQSIYSGSQILINPSITAEEIRRLLLGHNLRGAKALPPGIAKNLVRGKPLPPGIAKRGLSRGAITDLPHYDGYEWIKAGTTLVLVDIASRVIAKVLNRVFD